jgi:hypothetical protein
MPKLLDVCTVRTRDGRSYEGNRKAVSGAVKAAVKKDSACRPR